MVRGAPALSAVADGCFRPIANIRYDPGVDAAELAKEIMQKRLLLLLLPVLVGCGRDDLSATYDVGNGVELRMELARTHPFLSEYDRAAVLVQADGHTTRRALFPDTGGYGTTNLYRCNSSTYMLLGYFDRWLVDTRAGTIKQGECPKSVYIGVFEGGGDSPWTFHLAKDRPERKLAPAGG